MKTIGLIGGNGQIGAEVSLFLSLKPDVRVIPISRTVYGSTLLRTCGFECRHGALSSAEETQRLTEGCDLVADFSVPHGSPPEVRAAMRRNISNAVRHSTDASQYIYISTHGVNRLSSAHPRYRSYSKAKLYAERLAVREGRKAGKQVYVLRPVHVHGVIQAVSREYMTSLRDEEALLPDIPSFTVFVFTIAEALYNILNGREDEGTYTLVSTPQWSWTEFHEYFCRRAGVEPRTRVVPLARPRFRDPILRTARSFAAPLWSAIFGERELIDDVFCTFAPQYARKFRASYYIQRARTELNAQDSLLWRPSDQEFETTGARLRSLSDSRTSMHEPTRLIEEKLDRAILAKCGSDAERVAL